jgi:hypothetical protein
VVVVVGCVNENDCGGGGCLELSICECLDGPDGRRTEEDGVRTGGSHKEIESLNNEDEDEGFTLTLSVLANKHEMK